jgi:hypothetical protein
MKKVVFAVALTVAAMCAAASSLYAQQITIRDPAEYQEYSNAIGQTTPQAKAAAIEAFLTHYPQSVVSHDMLEQLMQTYAAIPDATNALNAADRLLKIDATDARALLIEVYFKSGLAGQITDASQAAQKQQLLDDAAGFATRGLTAPKPMGVADADWAKTKATTTPLFYSAIGSDAYNKGDYASAITAYNAELSSYADPTVTAQPSQALQDTFFLGVSYFKNTPADYISCVWYTDRAAHFAPAQFQSAFLPTAKYCYNKYHGKPDGFDAVDAMETPAQLNPPANYTITSAPKPADLAHQALQGVDDLKTMNLSDEEYILINGTQIADIQPTPAAAATPAAPGATPAAPTAPAAPQTDADRVWAFLQGQNIKLTDKLVIAATADTVTLAVSDDAVESTTADFSVSMTEPLKTVPTVGSKFTVIGTVSSYDKSPFLIHLTDGELPAPEKRAVRRAVHPAASH